MAFRLINENNSEKTLTLTSETWFGIMELAEEYGWMPLSTAVSGQWGDPGVLPGDPYLDDPCVWVEDNGDYDGRLVVIEDALNLADALKRAFLEYEPRRVPVSYFLFEPANRALEARPSIGAIEALREFSQQGAFRIEWYQPQRTRRYS